MEAKRGELSHRGRQCQSQGRTCCTIPCSGPIAYAQGYVSSYKNKIQLFQGFRPENFKVFWSADFQADGNLKQGKMEWLTWCHPAAQPQTWLQTLAFLENQRQRFIHSPCLQTQFAEVLVSWVETKLGVENFLWTQRAMMENERKRTLKGLRVCI